ncbi:MoxR family ATPase [Myxococcota bacterium]|nr:MoxR family ATPase [Myxococcota bacterium]
MTAARAEEIALRHRLVGRRAELRALLACLSAGRHVLLEGPVGVGKTALARAAADALGRGVHRVDGDGRYSEARLVGHHDPPRVLREGYVPDAFVPGPLAAAMAEGAVLLVNELNRMPEGVQNVLLPAMDEGLLVVPRHGVVRAREGFAVVATQNPREFVGTGHLSEALLDRFELLRLEWQGEEEERRIVVKEARIGGDDGALVAEAVAMVRATRGHPRLRRGASVRAAVSLVEIAAGLGGAHALEEAARMALPTRVEWAEDADPDLGALLRELLPSKKKP